MKRITIKTLILLVVSFTILPIHAQEIIVVDQGLGTLENAIATHGGDVIYQLNAGEWYGLEGIIEVSDASLGGPGKTLTIVGEETESMPPVIQVGVASDGSTHPYLFSASSNLTLRNVFLADQDFTGIAGRGVIEFVSSVRVIVDNCVIDPAGQNRTFGGGDEADGSKLYLNNNLILNNGHMQGPNEGVIWEPWRGIPCGWRTIPLSPPVRILYQRVSTMSPIISLSGSITTPFSGTICGLKSPTMTKTFISPTT